MFTRSICCDAAESLFGHLGVKVVTGQRYLGSFVGSDDKQHSFIKIKFISGFPLCKDSLMLL